MSPRKIQSGPVALSLAALALCVFPGQAAAREREIHFSVSQQSLDSALIDFAVQANVSIATPPGGLGGARARALSATLSPEAALRQLLADTGYTFVRVDAVSFRIVRADAGEVAPRQFAIVDEETLIVTARRRAEVLDRVPVSATVVRGAQIEEIGARGVEDMALLAAGLSYTNLGAGRDKIFVRSLSDGAFSGRTAATVGVYLDDTRVTYSAPNPDLLLLDVERVEVLRGPQGALYGGGAIGGTVHIVTRAPNLNAFEGSISGGLQAMQGGDLSDRFNVILNSPLRRDRLGLRVVGYREVDGGWLDNSVLDETNTNQTTTQGARVTLQARLTPAWTITARAASQSIGAEDSQYIESSAGDRSRTTRVLEPFGVDFALASVEVAGATAWGRLSSTTSLVRHSYQSRFDATGAFGATSRIAAFDSASEVQFLIEEAQLVGVASPFPWSIGLFFSHGITESEDTLLFDADQTNAAPVYVNDRKDSALEYALFGNVVWPFGRGWALDVGARIFRSQLDVRAEASGFDPSLVDDFSGGRIETGIAPDIQLSFEPTESALYYLRVSEGYRGSGYNTGASTLLDRSGSTQQPYRTFGGDRLWSAEFGAKLTLLDGDAHLRAATFWQYWENVQTDQLSVAGLPFTGNVGDAESRGIELEFAYSTSPDLRMSAHVTYSLQELVRPNASFPDSDDASLPGAPNLIAGATFFTRRDLGAWGEATLSLDALYVGRSDVTFADSSTAEIGGYFTGAARVSISRNNWSAALFVRNVTDSEAATFSYGNPFGFGNSALITPLRPRAVGVELTHVF